MLYESKHFEIESMHVVSKSESQKIHLVAVTYSGFRLYFTHHRDALRHSALAATRTRPDSLELVHVRLPPPIQPTDQNIIQQGPGSINIGTSFYDRGAFLASKCGQDEHDSILMASTRIGALPNNQTLPAYSMGFQNNLAETSAITSSDGKVWAIAETSSRLRDQTDPNEIAEQLTVPPRQFVVLTTTSLTFFHKQRPVDTLYHLLVKANGNIETDKASFASFFNRYGKTQACAMCLAVICANLGATTPEQADVVRGATKLFFEYGGVPSASGAAFDSSYLQSMTATGLQFSGKHDGFALYFSRLIRPLWKTKLFEQSDKPTPIAKYTQLQAAFTNVQWSLSRLKEFMDVNTAFHTLSSIADARLLSSDEVHAQVLLKEQQSLHELYLLLTQCIDAISFVDFLIDSGIEEIFQCVTDASKVDLREVTVESMVTTTRGRALSRQLVIAAINKYGRTQAHVGFDVVSDLLQRKCSSFFGPNDVSFYKGVENMRRAHHAEAEYERGRCLTESLKYFKEASDYLTEEQLDEISKEYGQQGFHVGTIELAIERAQRLDPQQQALSYLESNAPENDQRLYFYETRIKCYQYVFRTLTEVKNMRDNPKQVPQNSKIHDPYSHAARAFSAALAHRDKLFHYALYDWFIRMDMKADLLAVDTEYLIPFFRDRVDAVIGLDFLWQYCRRREQYFEAALYLEELALRSKGLGLLKRVEYLSLAVVNARCRDPKRQLWQESTQLLQYLEERVEVARLQVRLHQTLQNYGPETAEVAKDLEERLMDLHELSKYQEYINK
ncbi:hypothetical protein EC973_000628 [Apophysomyces ossiformis]|uniref:Uncharacterized protein n=1 Tax=Apophysomyces ossiformis TaxID=679940 RepID=A0A8H7EU28_9FUNG|nr:hypothetical protein EC973_000628 [Apophysomyces ossiformis]